MSLQFDLIDAIEKLKLRHPLNEVSIRQKAHFFKFFFFSEQCSNAQKHFLAGLSPAFPSNLTPYIKLLACVRTSCWSAKRISMSVRHGFMIQSKCQCWKSVLHFVSNINKNESFLIKKFRELTQVY